jgi:hypothetical protein
MNKASYPTVYIENGPERGLESVVAAFFAQQRAAYSALSRKLRAILARVFISP